MRVRIDRIYKSMLRQQWCVCTLWYEREWIEFNRLPAQVNCVLTGKEERKTLVMLRSVSCNRSGCRKKSRSLNGSPQAEGRRGQTTEWKALGWGGCGCGCGMLYSGWKAERWDL